MRHKNKEAAGAALDAQLKELKENPKLPYEDEAVAKTMELLPENVTDIFSFTDALSTVDKPTPSTPTATCKGYKTQLFESDSMLRFQLSKGEFSVGHCLTLFLPEEDTVYLAHVLVADEQDKGKGYHGLLSRMAIASAKKYSLKKVHSLPTAPEHLVWLIREGFKPQDSDGKSPRGLAAHITQLVREGQVLDGQPKLDKYRSAQDIFRRAAEKMLKGKQLYMVKEL